jgi:TPR repeat protein
VTQDDAQAFNLYDKGCLSDSAAACVNRGTMYWRGKGVGRNDTEAAISFQRGCDGGEPAGCLNASVAYHDGRGVQKDLERAYEFADRACTGGTLEGCTLVGAAKVLGEGVAKDVKGGLAQLNGLCKRKEASACDKYEGLYAKGVGTDVPADPLRVREAAKRACAAGSGQDCKKQELLDTVDRTSANPARGFALFETKCDAGMMSACGMLGEALYTGSLGGAVDRTRGKALREKACNGGYKPACKALGTLERGDEYRRALLRQDGDEA